MKQILKDAFILFAITIIAGVLLAVVNEVTKGPINEQIANQKAEACKAVFSDAVTFNLIEFDSESVQYQNWSSSYPKNEISEIYEAYDGNQQLLGYVISVTNKEGYGGPIIVAMGIRNDHTLNGVSILETSETVGLGLEAENVLVPQFTNKNVDHFTYTKNGASLDSEIDAISSATITTNAFVNDVNAGIGYFDLILSKGGAVSE